MATAKKKPAKKAAKKSSTVRAIPAGYEKVTFNLPTKLMKQYRAQAKRLKAAGKGGEDGRWGYGSYIREVLEKHATKFKIAA